jgi:sensor c-di-GMP phosphodiesterase-like protein
MIHPKAVHPWVPLICILWAYLAAYMVWVISLFQPRKDGSQRRWRSQDWMWVPLAGITGALLLALWWHMRQTP